MSWIGDIEAAVKRFDDDPGHRLMSEAARDRGVRLSRFEEWDIRDITDAVALLIWERKNRTETCQSCGSPPAAWVNERGRTIQPPPFVVEWETCHGCAAIRRERDTHGDEADTSTRPFLKPNPDAS